MHSSRSSTDLKILHICKAELSAILDSNILAIGFRAHKDDAKSFEIVGNTTLLSAIEKNFELTLIDELNFFSPSGKAGELFEIPALSKSSEIDRIFLVGVGDGSLSALRSAGAAIGRKVRGKALAVTSLIPQTADEVIAHGVSTTLGAYSWSLKTGKEREIPRFTIATGEKDAVASASEISEALYFARDLIHTPSNIKNPAWIAQEAKKLSAEKGLTFSVKSGRELSRFGGIRAVGGSSPNPGPRFVEVSYIPKVRNAKALPHVVIVGKGITYDTGGVSLKRPHEVMAPMKSDMAGAAAALAAISALPALKAKVRVTVLMALAENALSGTSQRPSDIITQYDGTTVEIINTDAEGRLVLADGLGYAHENLDPDYLVDIATLTGAATLSLGRNYAAMYTRDSALAAKLVALGEKSGDKLWHMPLVDDYVDALSSDVADLNHTADKAHYSAGSVTAALYLEQFVADRKWIHLDIAGPARSESDSGENPKGGTGFGVRFLIDWLLSLS